MQSTKTKRRVYALYNCSPTEVKEEQNEIVDEAAMVEVVNTAPSKSTTVQKSKKRKNNAAEKILLKKIVG